MTHVFCSSLFLFSSFVLLQGSRPLCISPSMALMQRYIWSLLFPVCTLKYNYLVFLLNPSAISVLWLLLLSIAELLLPRSQLFPLPWLASLLYMFCWYFRFLFCMLLSILLGSVLRHKSGCWCFEWAVYAPGACYMNLRTFYVSKLAKCHHVSYLPGWSRGWSWGRLLGAERKRRKLEGTKDRTYKGEQSDRGHTTRRSHKYLRLRLHNFLIRMSK